MKKGSTVFLKIVVWIIGLGVLALCVYLSYFALTEDIVGGYRPILLGLSLPAIPFFIALYKSHTLLEYIDKGTAFTEASVAALRKIKQCAVVIAALFVLGMPYIFKVANRDDAPGVVLIGCIIIGASAVIAVFAALLQKLLKSAIDIKLENELTV